MTEILLPLAVSCFCAGNNGPSVSMTDDISRHDGYDFCQVTPPSSPLVGIEPNPGPRTKRTTTIVSKVVVKPRKTKRVQARRPRRSQVDSRIVHGQRLAHILNDPFNSTPFPIGLGCMVPTQNFTFFRRGSFAVNATDGTFAIAVLPRWFASTTQYPIAINTAGAASATWTNDLFSNGTTFSSMYGAGAETRILGLGLRVIPSIAATSAPGELYAGAVPTANGAAMASATPNFLAATPYVKSGSAYDGAMVTARPLDIDAFTFFADSTIPTTLTSTWSIPFVTGVVPTNTQIYYEVVMHVEVLPNLGGTTIGLGSTSNDMNDDLSNYFPSLESLFKFTENYLEPAVMLTSHFINFASGGSRGAYTGIKGSGYSRPSIRA